MVKQPSIGDGGAGGWGLGGGRHDHGGVGAQTLHPVTPSHVTLSPTPNHTRGSPSVAAAWLGCVELFPKSNANAAARAATGMATMATDSAGLMLELVSKTGSGNAASAMAGSSVRS